METNGLTYSGDHWWGNTWPTAWPGSSIPVHFACNYVEEGNPSPTEADFTVLAPTVHPVGSPQQP